MPEIILVAFDGNDPNGTPLGELTEAADKSVTVEHNDLGGGSFTISRHGDPDQLEWTNPSAYVKAYLDDTSGDPVAAFWIEDSGDQVLAADEEGAEVYVRQGRGPRRYLAEAVVWYESVTTNPSAVPGEDGYWHWGGVYPGGIMVRMLEEAQERGCLPDLTYDFSRTLDSNGDPWTLPCDDFQLEIGVDLLTVSQRLSEFGVQFRMDPDLTLHAYEAIGEDLSATITLEKGVEIAESAERVQHWGNLKSTQLVRGKRGDTGATIFVEVNSPSGIGETGRRIEGFVDAPETTGWQVLQALGQKAIWSQLRRRAGPTLFRVLDSPGQRALVDYRESDTITIDVPDVFDEVTKQITTINLQETENGEYDVTVGFDEEPTIDGAGGGGGGGGPGTVPTPAPIDRAALGEAWKLASTEVLTDFNFLYGSMTSGNSGAGSAPANPTYGNDDIHANNSIRASWAMGAGTATWWWQTDLAAPRAVDSFEVYSVAESSYDWDNHVVSAIEGSANGSSWTALSATRTTGTYNSNAPGNPTVMKAIYTFASTETYRYFRISQSITLPSGIQFFSASGMSEWKIYGDESSTSDEWTDDAPNAIDGNDTTYEGAIGGTDVLRVDLRSPYVIVRSRLRIACENAGSKTYTIKGANAEDFSDEVTLATFTFTGTGSYAAQDVETLWVNTTPYRWYELSGTSENRRIHTWELYEGTATGGTATAGTGIVIDPTSGQGAELQDALDNMEAEVDAHLGDTADAHDASAVSIVDAGGYFTGTDVEAALQELGAGGSGGLPWFIVTNYGATGDGTTDDTSSINSAIAALNAAGGGVLYFPHPADAYKITTALTTITAPCVIRGDGAAAYPYATGTGSRIEQTSDTASVFTFTDPGWVIEDIAIINTEGAPTAGSAIVAASTAPLYARMSRIEVGGFYDCIDLNGNGRWALTDSFIYDPVRYGVRIRGADDGDQSISGCYFMSDTHDADAAIRQEGGGGLKVVNTKVNVRGVSGGEFVDGISVSIGAGVTTAVLVITGSSFENMTGDAIDIATVSTGSFADIVIAGCQFGLYSNNTGRAVKIAAATNGTVGANGSIADVIIDSCAMRTDGTARAAIELTNTDRVTLGDIQLIGFNARYTSSGDTNTTDGVPLSYAGSGDIADVAATEGAGAATSVARGDHVHALGITTTRGDLIRRGASANERVALGASGYVLTSDGTDAVWAAPSAGGGHYEVIVSGSAPPVAVTNEAEDDWLYGWVPD